MKSKSKVVLTLLSSLFTSEQNRMHHVATGLAQLWAKSVFEIGDLKGKIFNLQSMMKEQDKVKVA